MPPQPQYKGVSLHNLNTIEETASRQISVPNRADPIPLERFCTHFNFEPMAFSTADDTGSSIYHTNVIMCTATDFVLVGSDSISNPVQRKEIHDRIAEEGRTVIPLRNHLINEFAGSAIERATPDKRILAISSRAEASLATEQKKVIKRSVKIVGVSVPTIELAGGSVRCMLAGIHLAKRYWSAFFSAIACTILTGADTCQL